MAKIGFEVEGKYKGKNLLTYFCSAEEYLADAKLFRKVFDYGVDHVYICDHLNELDLGNVEQVFYSTGVKVTVELTQLNEIAPAGVEIMWNASQASYLQSRTIQYLRPFDQIKVENELYVMCWEVHTATFTLPEDFNGDREV